MSRWWLLGVYLAGAGAVGWFFPHALPFLGLGGATLLRALKGR